MEPHDLDRLADLIARELLAATEAPEHGAEAPRTHRHAVPAPVWNQPLRSSIAPPPDAHLAARTAAANRGPEAIAPAHARPSVPTRLDPRARHVPIGVSPRYVILSDTDWRLLFGAAGPTPLRELGQPGQVAFREVVRVAGPGGEIDRVRVIGPLRQRSRVAVSRTDARRLGLDAPVRLPGDFADAAEATVVGPNGSCRVATVTAAAHVHLDPERARMLGLRNGDRVGARIGGAARSITLHDLAVLVGPEHRPELHIDADEANAAGVASGDAAVLTGLPGASDDAGPRTAGRRRLVTERDVAAFAARGEFLSPSSPFLVTPAARDRARHLGIWRDHP